MQFLNSRYARALTAVLLLQGVAYYAIAMRHELTPPVGPLAAFPFVIGEWRMIKDYPVDPEVQAVLKADDTLSRSYVNADGKDSYLWIAFFQTQRFGQSPHSPKNCLPGAGYTAIENTTIQIAVPQWNSPIRVNKYVTERGEERSVSLYWYQSHNRIIPSEYWAKFWLVADAIRYRRSDTSIVRVVVPVKNSEFDAATETGVKFIQAMFPDLLHVLPA